MIPGRGVWAMCGEREILAGSRELLEERGVELPDGILTQIECFQREGCTAILVAIEGKLAGFLALSDTLRPEAATMIKEVRETGITPVLLTGDHKNTANHIARQLAIQEFHSGCLPEDKLTYIEQSQRDGRPICMIGDGINDAPALKKAWVGIAMGGIGSDIAVDAADITLVNDDIREIPHLLRLARRMMHTIKYNLAFSMCLNFVAIFLAITGVLNPVVGALVHNAGSVLVIINSALLLKWRS